MSCTVTICDFFNVITGVFESGGVGEIDAVPFVVEGGGVGEGDSLNFCGENSSFNVGDSDGEGSSSVLGSSLSSLGRERSGKGSCIGSSIMTWLRMSDDGGGSNKLAVSCASLGWPNDGLSRSSLLTSWVKSMPDNGLLAQ